MGANQLSLLPRRGQWKPCAAHPEKRATAKGLCMACYVAERRRAVMTEKAENGNRRQNGAAIRDFIRTATADDAARLREALESRTRRTEGDACHEWTGAKNRGGYGVITLGAHSATAHRVVAALRGDDLYAEVVMHTCDNPGCVNPAHLKSGTYKENSEDCTQKGRRSRGVRHATR